VLFARYPYISGYCLPVFPASSVLALAFGGIASYQDLKRREVDDFLWVLALPSLALLYPLLFRNQVLSILPLLFLLPAAYFMARANLLGQADVAALALFGLGFPQGIFGVPAYLWVFLFGLLGEMFGFALITAGKSSKGGPRPLAYRVKREELGPFWIPVDSSGKPLFELNDPRPLRELVEEAKQRVGDYAWAYPALPMVPFMFVASLAAFPLILLRRLQ